VITTKSAIHLVLLAVSGSAGCWAAGNVGNPEPQVAIRLLDSDRVAGLDLRTAKDVASMILTTAGVHVGWQDGGALHTSAETIDIRFSHSTLRNGTAGALAVSLPYARGGVRITVFVDRVADYANRNPLFMPRILGHVLAHEIGHVLRGTDAHSLTGVMKAHWDRDDYRAMRVKIIEFTSDDAARIASHLAQSHARAAD
jgi:hypothetical protein